MGPVVLVYYNSHALVRPRWMELLHYPQRVVWLCCHRGLIYPPCCRDASVWGTWLQWKHLGQPLHRPGYHFFITHQGNAEKASVGGRTAPEKRSARQQKDAKLL